MEDGRILIYPGDLFLLQKYKFKIYPHVAHIGIGEMHTEFYWWNLFEKSNFDDWKWDKAQYNNELYDDNLWKLEIEAALDIVQLKSPLIAEFNHRILSPAELSLRYPVCFTAASHAET
jgi:hypothetical protein